MGTTELLHFHFSLSYIGEGNGNPLRYSCLKNPRDGGAWWAAVYRVAQSQTRLKRLSSSSSKTVPDGPVVKNVHASARDARDTVSIPGLERSPGEGNGHPLLPRKSHGQRSLVGYSPCGRKESDVTERLSFYLSIYHDTHF